MDGERLFSVDEVREIVTLMDPSGLYAGSVDAAIAELDATREQDGKLRAEDLDVTVFRSETQMANYEPIGVRIVHKPTGIGRESTSKPSQLHNREVALKALTEAVQKELRQRG
jgi:protein subunit release factor A